MSRPLPPNIPNPYRLKAEWQHFYRRVLPDGASEVQTQEMRRAYYSGAEAALRLIMKGLEGGTEPTISDLLLMDHFSKELEEFADSIQKGEA